MLYKQEAVDKEDDVETKNFHMHLVSDATGETIHSLARACAVQFENGQANEHLWMLVRNDYQLDIVLESISRNPGPVLYTLVDERLRKRLEDYCRNRKVPYLSVLDPVTKLLEEYLGQESKARPGRQHKMDEEYFQRIDALDFAIAQDDGQGAEYLRQAEIILVGVSRTSKTPTSLYLANRGIKTANVPMIPDQPLPAVLFDLPEALIIGLTCDPQTLMEIRRSRLKLLNQHRETSYVDLERIYEEVAEAHKLFRRQGWPILDVTRRSIEETAAEILLLYNQRSDNEAGAG